MVKYNKFSKRLVLALIAIIIIMLSFMIIPVKNAANATDNSSYIVMEASGKVILKGYNMNTRLPMASTTKVMTALVVVENCQMDEKVTITKESVGIEGSSIYLKEGEVFTVEELLYGLMLRSGNDASVALAIHVAGSVENFATIMNIRAESMGLTDTHFVNPNGLHDANHYTSSYDLCYISCEAMQNPTFRKIVGTKSVTIAKGESARFLKNKNKILSIYEGGNGIKTGYTKKAGRCLVASAERNNITMVSVVLNRGDMWTECSSLLSYGFENFTIQD